MELVFGPSKAAGYLRHDIELLPCAWELRSRPCVYELSVTSASSSKSLFGILRIFSLFYARKILPIKPSQNHVYAVVFEMPSLHLPPPTPALGSR